MLLRAHGVPVQVQNQPDGGILLQIGLDGLSCVDVGAVVGGVVVQLPVLNGSDACFCQKLSHVLTDGEHIVLLVQGPPAGGFHVGFPCLGVAFGGMGVQDQHGGLLPGQIPA